MRKKIYEKFELIVTAYKMSPSNFLIMFLNSFIMSVRALIYTFIPAILINLVEDKYSIYLNYLFVGIVSFFILIADSSERFFSILSTAFGYKANNMATLSVGLKSMRIKYADIEDPKINSLSTKAKMSTWVFSNIADMIFENWLSSLITLIPVLYVISKLNPVIFMILFILIIIELAIERHFDEAKYLLDDEKSTYEKKFKYNNQVFSELKYGKELRLYQSSDSLMKKQMGIENTIVEIQLKQNRLESKYKIASNILLMIKMILVYLAAIHQYYNGAMLLSQFVLFTSAIHQLTESIKTIIETFTYIEELNDYYKNYSEYNKTEEEKGAIANVHNTIHQPNISVKDLSFMYPNSNEYVLRDINISIPYGKKIAIVGENGSGKSTLIKLLVGLYEVNEGEITVNSKDIGEYPISDYRGIFSVVFQDFILHPYSIRENIAFFDKNNDSLIQELLKKQGVYEPIEKSPAGLDSFMTKQIDKNGIDFSGGEKQKIAMVRALYKNSDILILDEPTSAMDPFSELAYYENLNTDYKDKTIIFISHRMSSAKYADIILVIKEGRIVETGEFEELIHKNGEFHRLFTIQSELYNQ